MDKKSLARLEPGMKVRHKYSRKVYVVARIWPYYKGALLSKDIQERKPDGYYIATEDGYSIEDRFLTFVKEEM